MLHKLRRPTYRPTNMCKALCPIFFNSFAANFLTNMFSQCHIYFNSKGHHVMKLQHFLKSLFYSFYSQLHFINIPKSDLSKLKKTYEKKTQSVNEGNRFEKLPKAPISKVGSERVKGN